MKFEDAVIGVFAGFCLLYLIAVRVGLIILS